MRINRKLLLAKPDRRRPTRYRAALLICGASVAGLGWVAWTSHWFGRQKAEEDHQTRPTDAPMTQAVITSQISTTIVRRTIATVAPTNSERVSVESLLEAQIALDRLALSPGSIDGVNGSQTRAALRAFQSREGLVASGTLDADTRALLSLTQSSFKNYRVELADLARLLPLAPTWLAKSEQPRLDYESLLELVAEKHHAHPNLLRRLNPTIDWNAVSPGTELIVPAVDREVSRAKAAWIQIRLGDRVLQVFDSTNRLLAHFPCSIAQRVEKRPVGDLSVAVIAPNPDYMFSPENFPESAEARDLKTKLKLPPGPNNPVGTAWIGLNLPGYGIHGTPKPEDVGRTEVARLFPPGELERGVSAAACHRGNAGENRTVNSPHSTFDSRHLKLSACLTRTSCIFTFTANTRCWTARAVWTSSWRKRAR
ncbi:MAG TPA: L,D-transpeptidase [Verrucomicrobiae bacterium]